jgi:saccharopine dehydrogenase-like NADP-dependent oxidoreductase
MNNKNIHIGIVGAGRIGTAIYELLVSSNSYKVSIADQANKKYFNDNFVKLDVTLPDYDGEITQFNKFVNGKSLIINALPYTENIALFKTCLEYEVPYFDLSEDDSLDKWIEERSYISPTRTGISFTMPHCGLAPGMSTVAANNLITKFDVCSNVKIRVGALSQNATNKLRYHSSWSGDGLVNEYLGDCQIVQQGNFAVVPALSGYEKITIDGNEYEAFHTSGGIGTFAKTLSKSNSFLNVDYKTLRRIGHHDYVDFLFNDLNLPQHELTRIFKEYIPTTRKDVVILYATADGYISNDRYEKQYCKVFKPEVINGRYMTAIEYTTAIGMIAMVELYLNDKLPSDGYVKQESVSFKDVLSTTFGSYYREE